jgi:hypothetical protein
MFVLWIVNSTVVALTRSHSPELSESMLSSLTPFSSFKANSLGDEEENRSPTPRPSTIALPAEDEEPITCAQVSTASLTAGKRKRQCTGGKHVVERGPSIGNVRQGMLGASVAQDKEDGEGGEDSADEEDGGIEKVREKAALEEVIGALFSRSLVKQPSKANSQSQSQSQRLVTSSSEAPAVKRRKTEPLPPAPEPMSVLSGSTSESSSISAASTGKGAKKSRPRKKLGWSGSKSRRSKASTATHTVSVPAVVSWKVVRGYNGPCKWPKIRGEGQGMSNVSGSLRYLDSKGADTIVKFIQCTACEAWYHFGCLSIKIDDPRTEDGVELFCPPCEMSM